MAFELRPGQGTLFQNDQKGNDRAPTHRGELCLEDGSLVKIAGWRKDGRKGPFLSLAIEKPREDDATFQRGGGADARTGGSAGLSGGGREPSPALDDDSIPFITRDSLW